MMSSDDDDHDDAAQGALRLDKWLWAARFFKTRALAAEALDKGQVRVNEVLAKRSRPVRIGDRLEIRGLNGAPALVLEVLGLEAQRGPAERAQKLYRSTEASVTARQEWAQLRRDAPNPGQDARGGRPTKRDRRERVTWERWSASLDDEGRKR